MREHSYVAVAVALLLAVTVNLAAHRAWDVYHLFFLFMVAISFACIISGPTTGLVATSISVMAVLFFFTEPLYTFRTTHDEEWWRLLRFGGTGVCVTFGTWLGLRLQGMQTRQGGERRRSQRHH